MFQVGLGAIPFLGVCCLVTSKPMWMENEKRCVFIVQISPEFQRTLRLLPPGIGTHSLSPNLPGENVTHFLQL